ncbi:hypothetical protein AAG906_037005 [Vitis piasezkii]
MMRAHGLDEAQLIMLFPMSLNGVAQRCRAFQKLVKGGLLIALAPRPPPYVTANLLPAHTTHSVSLPTGGIHHMDFVQDDVIHMLSWDDGLLKMIVPDDGYEIVITRSGRIAQAAPLVTRPFVSSVLLDNSSALNVFPLATTVALDFAPLDFGSFTQTARAIPSSLHQKVKFIHDGFTFDEVQTLEIQDFCRDFVAMSFDQHSRTFVLDMMRDMSFLPGFGFVDYFVKGSNIKPFVEEIGVKDSTVDELQHMLHQMQMGDETPGMLASLANMIDGVVPYDEYHDEIYILVMDLSIYEYSFVSCDDVSLLAPYSPTSQILDIDDEIAQHDSDERATLTVGDVEIVDFSTTNQPKERHLSASRHILFHDMMHRDVEVYVDDMIRIKKFKLRLNPKKCIFGVSSRKLLGYMVSERGIEVDPDKIRVILDMPTPKTKKEIRCFLNRLQYIGRFYLFSPPALVPPISGRPLILYLSVLDIPLGCMLAQLDDLGKEQAISHLSKRMLEYEIQIFCD